MHTLYLEKTSHQPRSKSGLLQRRTIGRCQFQLAGGERNPPVWVTYLVTTKPHALRKHPELDLHLFLANLARTTHGSLIPNTPTAVPKSTATNGASATGRPAIGRDIDGVPPSRATSCRLKFAAVDAKYAGLHSARTGGPVDIRYQGYGDDQQMDAYSPPQAQNVPRFSFLSHPSSTLVTSGDTASKTLS